MAKKYYNKTRIERALEALWTPVREGNEKIKELSDEIIRNAVYGEIPRTEREKKDIEKYQKGTPAEKKLVDVPQNNRSIEKSRADCSKILTREDKHLLSYIEKYQSLVKSAAEGLEDCIYSWKKTPKEELPHFEWPDTVSKKEWDWIIFQFMPALRRANIPENIIASIEAVNKTLLELTELNGFDKYLNDEKLIKETKGNLFKVYDLLNQWNDEKPPAENLKKIEIFARSIRHLVTILKEINYKQQGQSQITEDTLTDLSHVHLIFRTDSEEIMNRQGFIDLPITDLFCEASGIIENLWIRAETAMNDKLRGNDSGYISVWLNDSINRLPEICDSLSSFVEKERNKENLKKPEISDSGKYSDKLYQIAKETEKILNTDWDKIRLPLIDKATRFLINSHILEKKLKHLEVFGNTEKVMDFVNNLNSLANETLSFSNNDIGKYCAALFLAYDYSVSPQLYKQIKDNALGIYNLTLAPKPPLFKDFLKNGDDPEQNTNGFLFNRLNDYLSYVKAYLKAENLLKDKPDTGTPAKGNLTDTEQNGGNKNPLREKQTAIKGKDCWHSEDFLSVVWYGKEYTFNKTQALCVSLLWENGRLSEKTIGERIGSVNQNYRLIHTFRNKSKSHPAWDKIIVSDGKGIFKLSENKIKSQKNHS
jgi:hypothetical protein